MEALSEWLAKKLPEKRATQAELARYCNVTRANVTHWMKPGHVNVQVPTVRLIAGFFGVSPQEVPGPLFVPTEFRGKRKATEDDPFPNADMRMVNEITDIAEKLPISRKAKLLEFARVEMASFEAELITVSVSKK